MNENPAALFAEAKTLQQASRLAEAIALYSRAIELNPDYVEALNNLGNALGQAKRYAEGAVYLRRAADLRPDYAPIHHNLALVLANAKLFEESAISFRRAIELRPDFAEAQGGLGNVLRELGQFDAAIASYRLAIQLKPGTAETHIGLGHAQMALKRYDEAIAAYRKAIEAKPDLAAAHGNLGNALMELDRPEEAASCYRRAIELEPGNAGTYNNLGNALRGIERIEDTLESYDRALDLDPTFAEAQNNRGKLLLDLGRREEALKAFDAVIALKPEMTEPYFSRLRALAAHPDDAELSALEATARASEGRSAADRAWLYYALGTGYEARGRYDEAFENFLVANRLRRETVDYSEKQARESFDRIKRVFTRGMLEEASGFGCQSKLPIFIVGMPRSGTTLTEQILVSHPQVYGGGELPTLGKLIASIHLVDGSSSSFPECLAQFRPEDFRLMGEAYVSRQLAIEPSAERITDKVLSNSSHVGFIRMILPKAKIIHVTREPIDACVSAFCLPFIGRFLGFTFELGELGRYYRLHRELMDHWTNVLPEGAMLTLRYEDLVEDIEGQARRLLEFCELPWDERCLSFHETERSVRTASAGQVRRPIYRSSVARWKHYRKHLGPLIEALGPYAPESVDA
jgi:tetratricopeptide (TPR) repeat protein